MTTITIDGPTASGKSTIGRMLASELGYYYLYSGLLYRAVAYILINHDGHSLTTIAYPKRERVKEIIATMRYEYDAQYAEQIFYGDLMINAELKNPLIDQAASLLSTNKKVRELIDAWQRAIARDHNVVVDGRDAGTVVFPDAQYKFFLTAAADIRAMRWHEQQNSKGAQVPLHEVQKFIAVRDGRDSSRKHAPLKKASDGIEIDNSDLNLDQTFTVIKSYLR